MTGDRLDPGEAARIAAYLDALRAEARLYEAPSIGTTFQRVIAYGWTEFCRNAVAIGPSVLDAFEIEMERAKRIVEEGRLQ